MPSLRTDITNALTVDLEDWTQSVLDPRLPVTDRVVGNTDRLLELLDRHRVRATFFALGKVCEAFPALLPRIASAGHEIGSHGYGHELLHHLSPERFREDVGRSIELIGAQTGRRPIGYRAPAFSITRQTLWAGPMLAELGFRYSSSVFPIAGRRYGIAEAPRFPYRWPTCNLLEFPLTTLTRAGRNVPVAGGGYLRLFPRCFVSTAIHEANRAGRPAVLYLHPYELNHREIPALHGSGWRIDWRTRWTQALFRGRVPGRLHTLLTEFRFAPMAEVLRFASSSATRPPEPPARSGADARFPPIHRRG